MTKIAHIYKDSDAVYPSGVDIIFDNDEKVCVGNTANGIKLMEYKLFIIPSVIWQCDNSSLIEQAFPSLQTKFIGSPIEQIAKEVIEKFSNKKDLLLYLQNYKVAS